MSVRRRAAAKRAASLACELLTARVVLHHPALIRKRDPALAREISCSRVSPLAWPAVNYQRSGSESANDRVDGFDLLHHLLRNLELHLHLRLEVPLLHTLGLGLWEFGATIEV